MDKLRNKLHDAKGKMSDRLDHLAADVGRLGVAAQVGK